MATRCRLKAYIRKSLNKLCLLIHQEYDDDFLSELPEDIIATKAWTASKSCLSQPCLPTCQKNADYLSQLPKEIMFSIISSFTMKEVARFSLVSRRCEFICRHSPVLIFKDPQAMEKIRYMWVSWPFDTLPKERLRFVSRVDRALETYLGTTIDELQITFDLDHNWQSHVDKWAAFALDKQVKRLKLNFSSLWRNFTIHGHSSTVSGKRLDLPPKFNGFKSFLNSLCLKDVNVTNEFIDYLSHSSPLLEKLSIEGSNCLTRVSGSLHVKHLKVSCCPNLKKIDISAIKLQSFKLYNQAIELRIADASSLLEMSIGTKEPSHWFGFAFDSLSEHFSHLVYLKLRIPFYGQVKKRIDHFVAMPYLQHLVLQVAAGVEESIRGWIPVIAASPSLQKLTFKLDGIGKDEGCNWIRSKWVGFPLKCLKTLELSGYIGQPIDLELAFFVFENASKLEEVIVDFVSEQYHNQSEDIKQERLVRLQMKLPQGVKLTVN